jgi:sortase A
VTNERPVPNQGLSPGRRPGGRPQAQSHGATGGPGGRTGAQPQPTARVLRGELDPRDAARPPAPGQWRGDSYPPRPRRRPDDAPTEFIPRRTDTALADPPTEVIPSHTDPPLDEPPDDDNVDYDDGLPPESAGRKAVRTIGELLITAGLVVLLFVVYEVYVTDWLSAGEQHHATDDLDSRWQDRNTHFSLVDGQGFAKLHVPAFGPDYVFTLLEGTSDPTLEIGPGHYKGTALPGEPGNFSVAGHRVGKGAPFNDLDGLQSCDALVVETATDWFIYRVLPMPNETKTWQQTKANDPTCKGVAPLGGQYADTVGQEIVSPAESDVIAPIPHHPGATPSRGQQAALITLTTCHPRFSAKQRLVVHGVLVKQYPKDPKHPEQVPQELRESS